MKKQQNQARHTCQFGFMCPNDAVRLIRYDTNNYENDKYAYACEEHLKHEV